ncbi:hypothetical protein B0H19DRAFT_1273901 [Mycena capillaripes]|nr:hypothetical protein B0H19DRAFT_1273901 [Mycena capillaripes]
MPPKGRAAMPPNGRAFGCPPKGAFCCAMPPKGRAAMPPKGALSAAPQRAPPFYFAFVVVAVSSANRRRLCQPPLSIAVAFANRPRLCPNCLCPRLCQPTAVAFANRRRLRRRLRLFYFFPFCGAFCCVMPPKGRAAMPPKGALSAAPQRAPPFYFAFVVVAVSSANRRHLCQPHLPIAVAFANRLCQPPLPIAVAFANRPRLCPDCLCTCLCQPTALACANRLCQPPSPLPTAVAFANRRRLCRRLRLFSSSLFVVPFAVQYPPKGAR